MPSGDGMDTLPFRTSADVERALPRVLDHLRGNGVLAYPTETVYGFGCALRPAALERLASLKRRIESKPFLVLVATPEQVAPLVWTDVAMRLAAAFWPGPLTIALAAPAGAFPEGVRSEDGNVAVRATPHPGMRRLLQELGEAVTSSSANAPGQPAALDAHEAAHALTMLGSTDALVLDGGRLAASPPSTVVDASGPVPRILREGAIRLEELRTVIGEIDAG